MEPFELKVQQVTFEEQDLTHPDLDSFSNVVHYDSRLLESPSKNNTSAKVTSFATPLAACTPAVPSTVLASSLTSDPAASRSPDLARKLKDLLRDIYSEKNIPFTPLPSPQTIPEWIALDQQSYNRPSHTVAQPSKVKVTQVYNQSVWSELRAPSPINEQFLVNADDSTSTQSKPSVSSSDIKTLLQISANTTSAKKHIYAKQLRQPPKIKMAEDASNKPPTQSDEPFESVAEALHLQWSVIGNKNITPAPPEVVAQIVAEAERKLKAGSGPAPVQNGSLPVNQNSQLVSMTSNQPMSSITPPDTVTMTAIHQANLPHSQESSNPVSTTAGKELIRIPPSAITTTKEKAPWFGSSSQRTDDEKPVQQVGDFNKQFSGKYPQAVDLENDISQNAREIDPYQNSGRNTKSQIDEKNVYSEPVADDNQSVASSNSELESYLEKDTENFISSLPPFKTVDLKDILPPVGQQVEHRHSPPVKETSFRPVHGNVLKSVTGTLKSEYPAVKPEYPAVKSAHGLSSESESDNISEKSASSESGIQVSPDKRTMQQNRSSYIIPQIGPLFQSTPKSVKDHYTSLMSGSFTSHNQNLNRLDSGTDQANAQLNEVLKEKAKLEGQLEMLSIEAQATLQERAELQAQLASLKLKLLSSRGQENDAEKESLRSDLDSLRQLRISLEQSLTELQRQLEEKVDEGKSLQEELRSSQETSDKLQIRMKEIKDDLHAKEMTIQALKNKVAELYVEVQTSLQSKMEAENEARSAKNDLTALLSAKQWYQQQVQQANQARSELQKELTKLQAQAVSQGSIVERLKAENGKLRQQFSEIQQRALKEKEVLARHLETIEADMMDREAAFQEIQRERSFLEDTFNTKIQTVEDEKSRISALMQTVGELENQLDRAHSGLKKKQTQIFALENEQMDVMKKLTLSQENIVEKDRVIEELEQKLIEVESQLKAFQSSLVIRDSEILKLKEGKATTEIALKAALEEKASVDKALESLKSDMGKVEKSFKQMRQELNSKVIELNEINSEKTSVEEKLEKTVVELQNEKKGFEISVKDFDSKSSQISELQSQKISLESELILMKEKYGTMESFHENTLMEKQFLDSELVATREKLSEVQDKLQNLIVVEKEKPLKSESLSEEEMKKQKQLAEENEQLRTSLEQTEKSLKRDLTKQKARATKLGQDLKTVQDELLERQKTFDANVELLSSKLREVASDKERLETELNMAHRKYELSMVEQQDQIGAELQTLATELEEVRLQKQSLESHLTELQSVRQNEVYQYQQQLSALEDELLRLKEEQKENNIAAETNDKLTLELEKEKGRLAGLMQSNATLKQHVSQLEEALARRESSLVDLQGHMTEAVRDKEREEHEYIKRVQVLEESLKKEKDGQRDLRKQIGTKITENKKLRRLNDTIKQDQEQLRQDLEHQKKESEAMKWELDASKEVQLKQQTQLQATEAENKSVTRELERVKQQLADNLAREPVIQEQIQSLQWQLALKTKELEAAQEHVRLAEERQNAEIEAVKHILQEKNMEIETLRHDLSSSRQEKHQQQAKIAELRSALKASVQYHKLMKKLGKLRNLDEVDSDSTQKGDELPPLPFDLEDMDKLLQDTAVRALESKPLDNLQNCLSTLRAEISGLQNQMEAHTTTIETSTQSWNSLEAQVQELRHVVQTIASTTMPSSTTNSLAAAAVEAADKSAGVIQV